MTPNILTYYGNLAFPKNNRSGIVQMTNWQELHGDFFNDKKCLITGGAGFIGSHITEALIALGANIVVLDDLSGCDDENMQLLACDQLTFVKGDIRDQKNSRRSNRRLRLCLPPSGPRLCPKIGRTTKTIPRCKRQRHAKRHGSSQRRRRKTPHVRRFVKRLRRLRNTTKN